MIRLQVFLSNGCIAYIYVRRKTMDAVSFNFTL